MIKKELNHKLISLLLAVSILFVCVLSVYAHGQQESTQVALQTHLQSWFLNSLSEHYHVNSVDILFSEIKDENEIYAQGYAVVDMTIKYEQIDELWKQCCICVLRYKS